MSDEGRLVAGRYRVIKRIGTGAMGAVWQALDEVLHRTVAIKQLMLEPGLEQHEAEDARQRTMREGRIAARLHHPNAITVFDVVTDENAQPCLIMEYLDSTSLAQVLQQQGTLPPLEVARIGAQVASALREAHAVGIVHRDIKPGNILLADNGLVKITDFGISRAKDDVTVTKTGMIAGTPAYLAPEVAIGGDPGPESDVFSLGSTLYAASEGQPPFGLSENTLGLLHAVAAGQINPPRQSGPLTSVLAVMLHPETARRPNAQQSEELLASVARGDTPLGGPAEDPTRMRPAPGAAAGAVGGAATAGAPGGDGVHPHDAAYGDGHYADGHYADGWDDGYDDYYDGYDRGYVDYAEDHPADYDRDARQGPARTRAVPVGAVPYDDGYDDRYADDRYDDRDDRRAAAPPPRADRPDDDPEPGNWKTPAAVGGVVVVGMTAFFLWLFGGTPNSGDAEQNPGTGGVVSSTGPTSTSSTSEETTSTTTTEDTSERVPRQTEEVDPGGPPPRLSPVEPTDEHTPSSSTETTPSTEGSGSGDPTGGGPSDPSGGSPPPETEEENPSAGGGGSANTTS